MKQKLLLVLITVALVMSCFAVVGAKDKAVTNEEETNIGDIITNPWPHSGEAQDETLPDIPWGDDETTKESKEVIPAPVPVVRIPDKAKIKKIAKKKKKAKKLKVTIKKMKDAKGYQVVVSKTKKGKALVKKYTTKTKVTIKSKKLKKKKKLYVRVRAYTLDGKSKVFGPWSKPKKVKIKKK